MSVNEYKDFIKSIVDSTDNELLLRHWKKQLEWDLQHQNEIELTNEEWQKVEEGLADYKSGDVLSFEEFLRKK
jgi:hypothetical protein